MGKFMHDDISEQILVRLDVVDLIRYKRVCKSWKSLISQPRFVKAHHKRQVNLIPYRTAVIPNYLFKYNGPGYYMVGSSNGLACINSFDGDEIIVANPWTREERIMKKLPVSTVRSCWGFGHDALTNDYKVVCGVVEGLGKTAFHVLSLKSNVWKHAGLVNYSCFCIVQIGTLRNGELHWVMYSTKGSIISFDLSTEVFKEINPSDDAIRDCVFFGIWVEYQEKLCRSDKINVKYYWRNTRLNYYTLECCSKDPYTFIPTTVMPSLVSPHLQEGNE